MRYDRRCVSYISALKGLTQIQKKVTHFWLFWNGTGKKATLILHLKLGASITRRLGASYLWIFETLWILTVLNPISKGKLTFLAGVEKYPIRGRRGGMGDASFEEWPVSFSFSECDSWLEECMAVAPIWTSFAFVASIRLRGDFRCLGGDSFSKVASIDGFGEGVVVELNREFFVDII